MACYLQKFLFKPCVSRAKITQIPVWFPQSKDCPLTLFSRFWPNYLSTSKLFFWCHNCSGFLKSSNKEAGFHLGLWQRKPCHTSLLSTSLLTPTESSNAFARQMHNLTLTKHAILIQISSNSSFCYSFYAVSSVFVKLPDHMYHLLVQRHLQASSYTVL